MEVISKQESDKTIIYLMGELDNHNADYARTKIDDIMAQSLKRIVVFDLKLLSFMDSTGIGVLIGRYKKAKGKQQLFVKNPSRTVDKIFLMSGLYDIMPKV
ncbi:MAG: anti-sigma factor antagonist [Clostridia bacterium]|nr:anti-sigma factor antagonist [Clostridia bacterium]